MSIATAGHDEARHPAAFADDEAAIRRKRGPTFADAPFFRATRRWEKTVEAFLKAVEHRPVGRDLRRNSGDGVGARIGVK